MYNKFTKLVYKIVSLFLILQAIENREVLYESSEILIEEQYFFGIRLDINKNDVLVIRMEIDLKENYDVFPVMLAVQSDSQAGLPNPSEFQNVINNQNLNQNMYKYDLESIATQHKYQEIIFNQNIQDAKNQAYSISVFNLQEDLGLKRFSVKIYIYKYSFLYNNDLQVCKTQCSNNQFSNNVVSTGNCYQGQCECYQSYFGEGCNYNALDFQKDGSSFSIGPKQWRYLRYSLKQFNNQSKNYKFILKSQIQYNFTDIMVAITLDSYNEKVVIPNKLLGIQWTMKDNVDKQQIDEELMNEYLRQYQVDDQSEKYIYIGYYNNGSKIQTIWSNFQGFDVSTEVLQINFLVFLPIIIVVLVFVSILFTILYNWYKNKEYDQNDGSLNESRVQNMQQQIELRQEEENMKELKYLYNIMPVQSIEEVTKQFPKLGEIDECLICCLELEKGEKIRKTVCFHIFHQECIDSWWKKNKNCPACRKILTKQELLQQKQEEMKNSYIQNILTNKSSTILGTSQNLNFYDSCNDFMFQQGSDKFTIQQKSENKMDKDKNIIVFNNENEDGLKYSFVQSQGEENLEKNYGEQQKYENLEMEQQLQKKQFQNPFLSNKQDFQVSQKLDFEQNQQAVSISEDDGNKNDQQIKKDANIFQNYLLQSQQTNNKKGRQSIDLINDEYQMQIDSKKESYCQLNSSNEIQSVTKLKKKQSIQLDNVSDSTSCTNNKNKSKNQQVYNSNQQNAYQSDSSVQSNSPGSRKNYIIQNQTKNQRYKRTRNVQQNLNDTLQKNRVIKLEPIIENINEKKVQKLAFLKKQSQSDTNSKN